MTRRRFIRHMFTALQATLTVNLLSSCAAPVPEKDRPSIGSGLHYIPLNGRTLAEIAAKKAHHGDGKFLNPFSNRERGNFGRVLRWRLFTKNRFKHLYDEEPITPVTIDADRFSANGGLSITRIRHATFWIQDGDRSFLVDPVFGDLFWFIKDFSPLAVDPAMLANPDAVLITHGHYDHLDVPSLESLKGAPRLVSPPGYGDILGEMPWRSRTELDWFESTRIDGREITFLPCNHWTMRNPIVGPNTALWGSYLIRTQTGPTIYVSGDTAYFDGFAELGERYDIDIALFNLGAYEPRWFMAPSHTSPEETLRAFRELKAKKLMIAHWGTFRLGDEPVHYPPLDMKALMEKENLLDQYVEIEHGETWRVS